MTRRQTIAWFTVFAVVFAGYIGTIRTMAQTAEVVTIERIRPPQNDEPRIQVALLLDTSNSMDGLISQAKTQLWTIVNQFIGMHRDGKRPTLEVALYEYGNSGLSLETGYIRQVLPLTTDLDKVSEELFALKTNGGQEYCGHVIADAIHKLEWSSSPDDLKAIYIAGNEAFTQGPTAWDKACRNAISAGVVVNTIFCGGFDEGVSGQWKAGSLLADGDYFAIDQDRKTQPISAPQDKELADLSARLNTTYIPMGREGQVKLQNQKAQDSNAMSLSRGVAAQRAKTKSSDYYRVEGDLVSEAAADEDAVANVDRETLPEAERKMDAEELKAHVAKLLTTRKELQARILELSKAREAYVAVESKKQAAETGEKTLDQVMIESLQRQAAQRDFQVAEETVVEEVVTEE